MSTYQELKGLKIKYLSADTSGDRAKEGEIFYNSSAFTMGVHLPSKAWSSSSPLNDGRETQGFGTLTAGLVAGGSGPFGPPFAAVELYDGTGWTTGTSLPADRNQTAPATSSPQTAGLIFAGNSPPGSATNTSLEWDGSSWTSGGNYPATLARVAGAGTQTSALGAGGKYPHSNVAAIYDGSSWTAISNIGTGRYGLAGAGASNTSAVVFGGSDQSYPTFNVVNNTEEWDGSSWSEQNNLGTARAYIAGCGTQTTALTGSGLTGSGGPPSIAISSAVAEEYDGTSWTSAPNPAQARHTPGMGGNSSNAFMAGGGTPTIQSTTEELNTSINTITAAAWASGGDPVEGRINVACLGIQTASMMLGGHTPSSSPTGSESYDGTSWSEGNNLLVAQDYAAGAGTQAAGLCFGGAPNLTETVEYDGTNWSESGNLSVGRAVLAGCGTQTAGLGFGGYVPIRNATEEYDGSSWTTGGNLGTARYALMGFGTQTAGLAAGGDDGPAKVANVEEYNGTAWSEVNNYLGGSGTYGAGCGTQTAGLIFGGSFPSYTTATYGYDGTNWSTRPSMSIAGGRSQGSGTNTAALMASGGPPAPRRAASEEFTGETTALNVKTLTQS